VVDLDAALNEQLLDVAIGEPEPQVPADRDDDDVGRGSGSRRRRTVGLERGEGGEFSCRKSRCSKAITANATVSFQDGRCGGFVSCLVGVEPQGYGAVR
jgi:hypothetical protein